MLILLLTTIAQIQIDAEPSTLPPARPELIWISGPNCPACIRAEASRREIANHFRITDVPPGRANPPVSVIPTFRSGGRQSEGFTNVKQLLDDLLPWKTPHPTGKAKIEIPLPLPTTNAGTIDLPLPIPKLTWTTPPANDPLPLATTQPTTPQPKIGPLTLILVGTLAALANASRRAG